MPEICLIQTSVATSEDGKRLAAALLECHLAACVHITATGESRYHWQGAIETASEQQLQIKTTPELADRTIEWLQQHHPYTLPEIIHRRWQATEAYAHWVATTCLNGDHV